MCPGETELDRKMSWFMRNQLSCCHVFFTDGNGLAELSEDELGVLRRVAIVEVDDFLYDVEEANSTQLSDQMKDLSDSLSQHQWTL